MIKIFSGWMLLLFLFPAWGKAQLIKEIQRTLDEEPEWAQGNENSTSSQSRWTAPLYPSPDNREIFYEADLVVQDDWNGTHGFSVVDLFADRMIGKDYVGTRARVRFQKPLAGEDGGAVEVREAALSYSRPKITFTAGRMHIGPSLGPTAFFGPYPTMGQRRLDGAFFFIPVDFLFGGGGGGRENANPAAISFFYFPAPLSGALTNLEKNQALFLSQLRLRFFAKKADVLLFLNWGGAHAELFSFSTLNGGNNVDAAVQVLFDSGISLYADGAVQNLSLAESTSALTLGAKAEKIRTWGRFSLDEIIVETQTPLGQDPENPFTGGNAFFPLLAELPATAWYAKARARLASLFFEVHATNSRGDYTFGRLTPEAVSVPLDRPAGPTNEIHGLQTPLTARNYDQPAFLARLGVEF